MGRMGRPSRGVRYLSPPSRKRLLVMRRRRLTVSSQDLAFATSMKSLATLPENVSEKSVIASLKSFHRYHPMH